MTSEAFGTKLVPFDFDGNGSTDVFFVRDTFDGPENSLDGNEYAVWITGPQGVTGQAVIGKNAPEWSFLPILADFDGNGTTDLGFTRDTGTGTGADPFRTEFAVWTMNGTQVTGQAVVGSVTEASGWSLEDLADFDGNGSADLLFQRFTGAFAEADPFTTEYAVWTTNGTSLLSQAVIGSTTSDWELLASDHFDSNGTSGLLFNRFTGAGTEADPDRTEFAVWTLNGTQVTGQAIIGSVTDDSGWFLEDLADFDGNGSADLLFERQVDGTGGNPNTVEYAVWTTNGTSLLGQAVIGSTSLDWFIDTIADFDGNGTADLLFEREVGAGTEADPDRTEYAVWTMKGTQVTGQAVIGSVTDASGWGLDDFNDFNGDGATDLLFTRSASGGGTEFAVWLLNGAGVLDQKVIGTATEGWSFAGSADFNGDGIADLGFVNFSTFELGLWTLGANGSVISQSVVGTFDNSEDLAGWVPTTGILLI